ncbi:hypothetical protein ARALYDRAFT_892049 [Arabidopsis lyrata subsp. lyrata]|uniref:Uncharacterized protein n=1 Tax=Arabidopsis lyrata subsp. lyrata TaxID=81972 RepID=D7KGV2_ARALL|nr:hypothetical protein ARALYDRAFT_892049 [Arabidopsis lyrata subsp. lyrata]
MDVPKIMELREKIKNIKQILKSHVFSDFSSLGTGTKTEEIFLLKNLSDSCLVIDAPGPSVREELINNFCSRELTSYEQIYVGAERIYNRLNCLIRTNQEKWTIFPASWHVPYRLCIQLCNKTRVQVESILVNLKEKPDVEKLLLELKRTLEFEMELEMKFVGGGSFGDDTKEIGGGGNNSQKVEEIWDIEEESQTNILSSSILLFFTIKKSLKRCSALTKNQTLFNLFKVFQRVLKAYATKLCFKLPKGGTSIIAAATGMEGRIKVSDKDERMICYIVNTAEYCHKTSGDLAEEVSTIIDPPYADGVDISEVQLALSLGPRFYANIFRCKQISETGAHQMLLDAHDMKMIVLKVPSLARQTPTASYVEFVNHQMKRAEAVLKVITSPIVSVVDTYCALFPEGTPMEFQRILELKLSRRVYLMISTILVAAAMPEAPAPPLAVANPGAAVGFIANSEEVLTTAAEAATTSFMKLYSVTETAKDRPFRKLFNA